mgnify:FL=1
MPDITMCSGEGCPLKEKCWRYLAEPSEYWQSYFMKAPYAYETPGCEHYWPADPDAALDAVEER